MFSVETLRAYLLHAPELTEALLSLGIKQNNAQKLKQYDITKDLDKTDCVSTFSDPSMKETTC